MNRSRRAAADRTGRPTFDRAVPPIFDRLVVLLVVQAHAYHTAMVVVSWADYRYPLMNLVLFVASFGIPIGCAVSARRSGGVLSGGLFLASGLALLGVAGLQVVSVYPAARGGPAVWCWGAIGVTWLAFAAFRPAREALAFAATHSAIAVIAMTPSIGQGGVDLFRILADVVGCVSPALVAAQYIGLHVRSRQLRDEAAAGSLAAEAEAQAEQAIEQDSVLRLEELRVAAIPLLYDIVDGVRSPTDEVVAERSRVLAEQLRHELVEARTGRWLLDPPPRRSADSNEEGGSTTPGADSVASRTVDLRDRPAASWPGVAVFDPMSQLRLLSNADRAGLAALLALLRDLGDWTRVSVALTGTPPTGNGQWHPELAVVATGECAEAAMRSRAVNAACATLGAETSLEASNILLVQCELVGADAMLASAPTSTSARVGRGASGGRGPSGDLQR